MKEVDTISFQDALSSDQAIAIVRYSGEHVGLCLSLESNGDVEVVMKVEDTERLIEALRQAARYVR